MEIKNHVLNGLEKALESFSSQYGLINLNRLVTEISNDFNTLNFYNSLSLANNPTAELLMETCTKIEFIGIETYLINNSLSEYEKRLDYLYYSSLILLHIWLTKNLPVIKLTYKEPEITKQILEQAVWFKADETIARLNEIYDELEKNFR